ncbi:PREDICTED: butyrophilin-like protein 1 [Chinchilla lanigera]|uniref:Butyrophilin-like protein 1 n=1 Tax=Chinchilla lanigera TaxID=34839 RepID=A0A8C2VPW6_CHILA|nr:PREDICTED: butyrophilin-like protein 1 [Chinchilla lanigera]
MGVQQQQQQQPGVRGQSRWEQPRGDSWALRTSRESRFLPVEAGTELRCAEEEFQVIGPSEPIVAVLGGDATLRCSVVPAMNVKNMELRWFRTTFTDSVFTYRNQREQKEEQMAEYAGRTSLVMDFLDHGEAAVNIHEVRVSDNGMYNCFFKMGSFFEETNLELKVAGVGSAPQVHVEGPEEDGVRVVCRASGWFPKPQVQWRDVSGKKILAFSEAHMQDADELFSVEATLVVRDRSMGNVTCSILNPVLGQKKAMAIFIPEPFFPQASPWKPAFAVSLTVMGLLLFGAVYFLHREHSEKLQVQQEEKNLKLAKEEDKITKEQAQKVNDELQAELGQRKAAYLAAWRKAQLYADWRKEQFQALSVTLDPGSAHPSIDIAPGKTSLTWKEPGGSDTCSVLGLEGVRAGRCYWEVEITKGDSSEWTEWTVGVCREDVKRTGWYKESLEKGFWVVGWGKSGCFTYVKSDTVLPLEQSQDGRRVGVFLDYSEGDVSFYDMTDGSHIFSFPPASFSGTLFPYFSFLRGSVSLTICSPESGSLGLPAPLHNRPSVKETLRPSGEGLSSGADVGDVAPGVESPLLPGTLRAAIP